jgi:hypothetical protein
LRVFANNRKTIGTLGIIIGLLCFTIFFVGDTNKLIIPISKLFVVKYLIVITIINGGFYFIIFGILNYIGFVVPYFTKGITNYDKAKINIISIICLLPFLISLITTIFVLSETILWKIFGSLMLIYISYLLLSSYKVIKGSEPRSK